MSRLYFRRPEAESVVHDVCVQLKQLATLTYWTDYFHSNFHSSWFYAFSRSFSIKNWNVINLLHFFISPGFLFLVKKKAWKPGWRYYKPQFSRVNRTYPPTRASPLHPRYLVHFFFWWWSSAAPGHHQKKMIKGTPPPRRITITDFDFTTTTTITAHIE